MASTQNSEPYNFVSPKISVQGGLGGFTPPPHPVDPLPFVVAERSKRGSIQLRALYNFALYDFFDICERKKFLIFGAQIFRIFEQKILDRLLRQN